MAKTLWLDAAASAAIEQVCDEVQLDIAQRLERSLTTRFRCLLSRTFYPVWMPDEKSGCT